MATERTAAAMGSKRSTSVLDTLPVVAGLAFMIVALAIRFPLWRPVAALLAHAPDDFGAAFATLRWYQQFILFPLGVLTTIATLVVLLQQGTGSARGRLRVIAVLTLVASSLISTAAAEPLAMAIIAGHPELSAGALADLAWRWSSWQWVNLSLAVVVGSVLVLAHRLPAAPPLATDANGMTERHRNLLLLLGAATLFEGYDRFIVALALPYIGRDLGISEGDLGYALSFIRVGALLSIFLGRIADGFGRRRVLLVTILAYTVATAATGLSTGLATFVVFQLVATIFLTAELALAQVVIAEEFPAGARGRGQGLLGAFAALGAGVAALLFPLLQATPLGWRGLYFIGLLPLMLLAFLRRSMPETERWQRLQEEAGEQPRLLDVLQPGLRVRFVVLILLAAAATMVAAPMFGFASYRATNTFGWTPGQVSGMMITGGGIGLSGWFVFGRLADTMGRRLIGAVAMLMAATGVFAFYSTSWLVPAFALIVFSEAGVAIAINSLGTELFPTALRATAKSWITNAGLIGAMIGLGVVGAASEYFGGAHVVISLLVIVPLLVLPSIVLLPETSGQELEEIEPEQRSRVRRARVQDDPKRQGEAKVRK